MEVDCSVIGRMFQDWNWEIKITPVDSYQDDVQTKTVYQMLHTQDSHLSTRNQLDVDGDDSFLSETTEEFEQSTASD